MVRLSSSCSRRAISSRSERRGREAIVSVRWSASRTASPPETNVSARARSTAALSTLALDLRDRQAIAVRFSERHRPVPPRHGARLVIEPAAAGGDLGGEGIEVLGRLEPEPEAFAFQPFAAARPVVLIEHETRVAGLELDAAQCAIRFPAILHGEAENGLVPGETLLQVIHGQRRCQPSRTERLRAPALGAAGGLCSGLPGSTFGGHRHPLLAAWVCAKSVAPRPAPRQIPATSKTEHHHDDESGIR